MLYFVDNQTVITQGDLVGSVEGLEIIEIKATNGCLFERDHVYFCKIVQNVIKIKENRN